MKISPSVFFGQVQDEAKKITWPSFSEAWHMTVVVIVLCLLLVCFLSVINYVSQGIIKLILLGVS